jgi:chromosomal replication initiation ATPase DnaA
MLECTQARRNETWRGQRWPRNRWRLKRLQRDARAHALLKIIAAVRGIPLYDLLDRRRGIAPVCQARQLAMYLVYVTLSRPQEEVARIFDRQRSTVAHACHVIEDMREAPEIEAEIARIETCFATNSILADGVNENAA